MTKNQAGPRSTCPIANSLDLVGDKWSLLIVRDLMFRGLDAYGQFLASGEGISTNILADRLARLAEAGIVERRPHPTDRKRVTYVLTERGIDLMPVLLEFTLWAAAHLPGALVPPAFLEQARHHRTELEQETRRHLLAKLRGPSDGGGGSAAAGS